MVRTQRLLAAALAGLLAALSLAAPAPAAAVTAQQRMNVLSSWTQTAANSYNAWMSGRTHQSDWADYAFDWSTDYCSSSPDQPLGFDFRLSCARHDFGYRNYKAMRAFPANKPRLDDAFYADLRRRCATYSAVRRPACYSLAWTYYQAVEQFGSVIVNKLDLDRAAARLRPGQP